MDNLTKDALILCMKAIKVLHPNLNPREPCIAYEAYQCAEKALKDDLCEHKKQENNEKLFERIKRELTEEVHTHSYIENVTNHHFIDQTLPHFHFITSHKTELEKVIQKICNAIDELELQVFELKSQLQKNDFDSRITRLEGY